MWPTEATGWLLLAGVATLLLVLWQSLRRGCASPGWSRNNPIVDGWAGQNGDWSSAGAGVLLSA
jgi:hypothetical protein